MSRARKKRKRVMPPWELALRKKVDARVTQTYASLLQACLDNKIDYTLIMRQLRKGCVDRRTPLGTVEALRQLKILDIFQAAG